MPPVKKSQTTHQGAPQQKGKKAKQVRRFKLLAGQHIGPDLSQEPDEKGRYPSKTWNAGQVVDSHTDLRDKFGDQKFAEVGQPRQLETPGDATDFNERENPATFPGGQVSTGIPENQGRQTSPTETPDHVPQSEEEMEETVEGDEEPNKGGPALDEMTIKELKDHAEENDIDIVGCRSRAEIIGKINETKSKKR